MTRVALVQADLPSFNRDTVRSTPLGLMFICGQLERAGHEVRIFHNVVTDENGALDSLVTSVGKFDPEHVGITSMSRTHPLAENIAYTLRRIKLDATITYGGWHVSGCAASFRQGTETETLSEILNPDSPFDYTIAGEGELAYTNLIEALDSNAMRDAIGNIDGVGFFDKNRGIITKAPNRIKNLDILALPSWSGLSKEDYTGSGVMNIQTKRSCRFYCGFCLTPAVYKGGVKSFSPKKAVDYIEEFAELSPDGVVIVDEDFFADLGWVEEATKEIIRRKLSIPHIDIFASTFDLHQIERNGKTDLLKLMNEAGFISFNIGVESFIGKTLRKYNREGMIKAMMTPEEKSQYTESSDHNQFLADIYLKRTARAIELAKEYGFQVQGNYIIGNPGESYDEIREGFEKFSRIKGLLTTYIPIFIPLPGTKIWGEIYSSGKIIRTKSGKIDWTRFSTLTATLESDFDVKKLRNDLEQDFYSSERYMIDMVDEVEREPRMCNYFAKKYESLSKEFPDNKLFALFAKEFGEEAKK